MLHGLPPNPTLFPVLEYPIAFLPSSSISHSLVFATLAYKNSFNFVMFLPPSSFLSLSTPPNPRNLSFWLLLTETSRLYAYFYKKINGKVINKKKALWKSSTEVENCTPVSYRTVFRHFLLF